MNKLNRLILAVLLNFWIIPAFAVTPQAISQQVQISGQLCFGTQNVYPNVLWQYQEPGSTFAQYGTSTTISIPATTSNQAINTATLFPGIVTPIAFVVQEITNPPQQLNIGLSSGGPTLALNPQGYLSVRVASGTPTFYLSNTNSVPALVQVSCLSN